LLAEYDREQLAKQVDRLLGFVAFASVVRTSALTGRGLNRLLPAIDAAAEQWRRRIPTAELNDWLADTTAATEPPMHAGRPVRLRYVTQVSVGPPTFRVFTTGEVPRSYLRYLERRLRETFGFEGTPLDVAVRVRPRWEQRPDAQPASAGRRRRSRRR
jgi:GTP-binding protein